jgi:hypothetical protein
VARLEEAGDLQPLVDHEDALWWRLKLKMLALSSLQCTIAHQESRLLWIKEGDAPTKSLHVHANARRRKKSIRTLEHDGQVLVAEESKAQAFFGFFNGVLGTPPTHACIINFQTLGLPTCNLSDLGKHFTEDEIWGGGGGVIRLLPPDKAPGPDGFTGRFLQAAWPIIRANVMAAFDTFWHLDTRNLHNVNDALMVLLPKSAEAITVKDFSPISLIHDWEACLKGPGQ